MKKCFLFGLITVAFISCQSDMSKVETLIKEYDNVQQNEGVENLSKFYPGADGLGLRFIDMNNAKITFNEVDSTYLITLTDNTTMNIEKQADGTFVITDSHGLVNWNEVWINVFLRSGAIERDMSDMKINSIINDRDFVNYLINQNPKAMQGNLVVTAAVSNRIYDDDFSLDVDIRNESKYDYNYNHYTVEIAVLDAQGNVLKTDVNGGKEIRAGEIANFFASFKGEYCKDIASHKVTIKMNGLGDIDKLNNFVDFSGEEYNNYLSTK